jgi:hypothetical protein
MHVAVMLMNTLGLRCTLVVFSSLLQLLSVKERGKTFVERTVIVEGTTPDSVVKDIEARLEHAAVYDVTCFFG